MRRSRWRRSWAVIDRPALRSAIETVPPVVRVDLDPVLDSAWHPADGGPSNNTAIGAFAQSVWALRTFDRFERVVTAVIDLGGDTDTVAAIAGAIAGARFGAHAIPERWRAKVHGYVPTDDGSEQLYDADVISDLAVQLIR